jgi:hydrogenase maturation protease
VIGCGNLLRCDDAAGPLVIRHLWQRGLDRFARLVDGGTAGMDVGFAMRGMRRVVLVDASATGAPPGTIHRVPGDQLEHLPDLRSLHSHSFRWDHALAFARWLLKDEYPASIEVWLIEAADLRPGCEITKPVRAAIDRLCDLLVDRLSDSSEAAGSKGVPPPGHGELRCAR